MENRSSVEVYYKHTKKAPEQRRVIEVDRKDSLKSRGGFGFHRVHGHLQRNSRKSNKTQKSEQNEAETQRTIERNNERKTIFKNATIAETQKQHEKAKSQGATVHQAGKTLVGRSISRLVE